ncbi:MAG: MATE family efflux transporter [Clostridia bacterium]|nr:MATE family efflux transporter [Clostridia bacterium]
MKSHGKLWNFLFGIKKVQTEEGEGFGELYKSLLIVAWPAALEGMLVSLMNSFDTMMVGKLGAAAIAAVGLCGQPRMILLLVAQALCVGTTSVIARRKGQGRQDAANSCLKQSLLIITFLGILMMAGGYFLAEPFLKLAGANAETLPDAAIYFRITSLAFLANCWALCICAAQRGVGKTRITMITNMCANVVNIILNYCLINGHFGFPALGVRGAAIATAIGTCVSFVVALFVVLKKNGYLSILGVGSWKFDKETLSGLVKVGGGSIAESVFLRIGFLVNGRLIADVGTTAFATHQVVQQVTSLSFTLGDGVSSACTALVGQALGAKKYKRALAQVKVADRVCIYMSAFLIVFIFSTRNLLPQLFSEDPEIIAGAALSFIVVCFGIVPQNKRVVFSGCLRGAGDVKFVAWVSLFSVAILRPALTWLFCYPVNAWLPTWGFGFTGPWLSFGIDAYVRAFLLTRRINKGEWVNIKL